MPDEITTRILYAAAARVAADLAADGLDQAALDDLELGARMAAAVEDFDAIVAAAIEIDPTGATLTPSARSIADRALAGEARQIARAA